MKPGSCLTDSSRFFMVESCGKGGRVKKRKRKLHIARPASATEIFKALRISKADIKAAKDALDR